MGGTNEKQKSPAEERLRERLREMGIAEEKRLREMGISVVERLREMGIAEEERLREMGIAEAVELLREMGIAEEMGISVVERLRERLREMGIAEEERLREMGIAEAVVELLREMGIAEEEANDLVPPEIRARGPEALKAYEEAVKGGSIKNARLLVIVLGPPRAGKTSLLRTLKGDAFDPKEESTIGVELQQAFCKPKNECWSEAIEDMSYTSCIAEIITEDLKRQSYKTELNVKKDASKYPDNQNAPSKLSESAKQYEKAKSTKLGDEATMSKEGTSKLPENIEEKVINRLKKPETKKANEREMAFKILDFAGQAVYNAIHPLFLSWKAVYILVHNLENNLHSCLTPKVEHGGSKRELVDPFEMTSLENLEFWLSSITAHSNVRGNLEGKVRLPPVFIACTHADKLENTHAKQIVREIYRSLSPSKTPSGYHVVRSGIYTVDNTLSENGKIKDASAKKLKEDIEEMSKSLPQTNEDVPITWLLFEEELTNLLEKDHKKYIDIDEAMTIANKCKVNTEIESREFSTLLNYLHDLKTIIYFEETKTVFIDTRWLINMFTKVITVLPVEQWNGFDEFWEKLEEEGVLERALVEHVWSDIVDDQNTVDSLLLVMEKFSLICRWKLSEQEIYLVPSMLCNSKKKEKIDELLTDKKSSTMAVRFKMTHLPLGIFPRLFVAVAEYAKREWPNVRQPKLSPNFCRFYNAGKEGEFDLCIASDIRSILVTVFNKYQIDGQHVTEFCQSQRKSLDSIFNDMQRNFPWMQNMEFDYGIRCPICLESSNKCRSHKITGCTRDSCLHIIKEEELKSERPECHEDDTNLDYAIKEEAYSHWFPSTKKDDAEHFEELDRDGGGSSVSEISTFNLSDEQKRWVVIGISLNKVLLPTLRKFVKQKMEDHYIDLKTNHNMDTQTHPGQLRNDGTWNLNYRNINNNEAIARKENYDYKVKSAVDLAKLYLQPHMAKFSGFDDTCDMSAVLGILSSASVFSRDVQDSAKIVRQDVRNEWGHCNIVRWDDATFKICFQKMDDLLKALTLSPEEEDKVTKELGDWENKGVKLCMASTVDADLVKLISVEVSQLSQGAKRLEANQKEEADRISKALQSVQQAIDYFKKEIDKKLENIERDVKGIDERVESLESERRNRSGCSSVLLKQDQSSLLCTIDGDASRIFSHLKTRHKAVLKTSCSELPHDRQKLVRGNFFRIFSEKDPKITTKEQGKVITYKTVDDLRHTFKELGIDIGYVKTSYISEFEVRAKEISEDDAVTAYLKQAARKILKSNSNRIHSIIPYHHLKQTAVVIYTYYPTQALFEQDWSKEFLGFPVFVVNLMFGYATEPPSLPKSTISSKQQEKHIEVKGNVVQQLEKKHSNLSTICVDYKMKGNQLVQGELCLQIGVLTKGIIPLGEENIFLESDGVLVDVVESSATVCVQSFSEILFWPVNVGVGIGVEGDDTCTGSLGAVVKHNETGELFILSNAHVLCREGVTPSSIVQPSQQDYEKMRSEMEKSIEEHKIFCGKLRDTIKESKSKGKNVKRQEEKLKDKEEKCFHIEELLKRNCVRQQPRKIAAFSSTSEHFVRQNYLGFEASKEYGIDAAIALIAPHEFEPEDMTEMYEWPNDLKDDDGRKVNKISLNGRFKTANEIRKAILSDTIVYKCGRTSGVTRGILSHEIVVDVGGRECTFEGVEKKCPAVSQRGAFPLAPDMIDNKMWRNVLMIKSATVKKAGRRDFSAAGDSGAVVFDEKGTCVGLLFGRIDSQVLPSGGGLATPIHAVFNALNISLATKEDLRRFKVLQEEMTSNS